MITLRPYQREAVDAVLSVLAAGGRPVAQLATGTGKSLIIAELARKWPGPVLVLAHVQELIEQNLEAFQEHTGETAGVYCSGLGRRESNCRVTFATVQSVQSALKRPGFAPTLVLIDESHRVPNLDTPGGLFHRVLNALPLAAVAGLTATPWP
jgi:DNA repair protein RadD